MRAEFGSGYQLFKTNELIAKIKKIIIRILAASLIFEQSFGIFESSMFGGLIGSHDFFFE